MKAAWRTHCLLVAMAASVALPVRARAEDVDAARRPDAFEDGGAPRALLATDDETCTVEATDPAEGVAAEGGPVPPDVDTSEAEEPSVPSGPETPCRPPPPAPADGDPLGVADEDPAGTDVPPPPEDTPAVSGPPPPWRPYSIPWLMRPLPIIDVVRLDTAAALHDAYGPSAVGRHLAFAQVLTLGFRIADWLQMVIRQGYAVSTDALELSSNGSAFVLAFNALVPIDPTLRMGFFLGFSVPQGGANSDPANRNVRLVRSAMENALWLPNFFTTAVGSAFAWVDAGWTFQVEATLFVLAGLYATADAAIVNASVGAQLGYFFVRELSASLEVHHQHFLSDPVALTRAPPAANEWGGELRSQTSMSVGLRAHVHGGDRVWFRPGISYSVGFDPPMAGDSFHIVQLDLPLIF